MPFSGSNPDLSARTFVLGLLLLLSALSHADVQSYLKLRKQHGISQATTTAALETLVGSRTLEVAGTVKGVVTGSESSLLVLVAEESDLYIRTEQVPDWLTGGQVQARLLIRAERDGEFGALRTALLGAAPESSIRPYDPKVAPRPTKIQLSGNIGRRAPAPKTSATNPPKDWNLSASEALPYYASFIKGRNKKLSDATALKIAENIIGFSLKFGVDARLIMAMVLCESNFDPNEVSHAGARGLGQLMPGTARGLGVRNSFDIEENLYGTVKLIRGHLDKYGRQAQNDFEALVLSLAAYNAGSGAVRRHGGVPPFRETQNYVRKVTEWYRRLAGE